MSNSDGAKVRKLATLENALEWKDAPATFIFTQDLLEDAGLFPRDNEGDWIEQADLNADLLEELFCGILDDNDIEYTLR